MTTFLVLAAGMVLGEAQTTPGPVVYSRESIAEALADSLRFEPSLFAPRDAEAEEAFMAFAREAAFETAHRVLPRNEVLELEFHPGWLTMDPVTFSYADTVMAQHYIEIRCLQLLQQLMEIRRSSDLSIVHADMKRMYGVSRDTSEVPPFVDAYFEHVLDALRDMAEPFEDGEAFQLQMDLSRAWVAANLDSPLPEDAHTRLTTEDFDRVVEEMRSAVERSHEYHLRVSSWNPNVDAESFEERAARHIRAAGAIFAARRYIELAWDAGFVTFLPRMAIEHRIIELQDDSEFHCLGQQLHYREIVGFEGFPEELRRQASEQLQRLE